MDTMIGADKARLAEELVLPYELYLKIFSYLSPPEIGRLLLVCKVCMLLRSRTRPVHLRLCQTGWSG
jgi:hypothetical protein